MADREILDLLACLNSDTAEESSKQSQFGYDSNSVYVDTDGAPTDPFLQALRSNATIGELQNVMQNGNSHATHNVNSSLPSTKSQRSEAHSAAANSFTVSHDGEREGHFPSSSSTKNRAVVTKKGPLRPARQKEKSIRQRGRKTTAIDTSNVASRSSQVTGHIATSKHVSSGDDCFRDEKDAEEIENAAKLKTLSLRLRGQQNTIRVMEAQLQETLQALEDRNSQLIASQMKVKHFESKERVRNARQADRVDVAASEGEASRAKEQANGLQNKLMQEQTRRQNAEHRAKALREYAEKAKTTCKNQEAELATVTAALNEAQTKCLRQRKELKEVVAENKAFHTEMDDLHEKIRTVQDRADTAEISLRDMKIDYERAREETRLRRMETLALEDKTKQMDMELNVARERAEVYKAQSRLSTDRYKVRTELKNMSDGLKETFYSSDPEKEAALSSVPLISSDSPKRHGRRQQTGSIFTARSESYLGLQSLNRRPDNSDENPKRDARPRKSSSAYLVPQERVSFDGPSLIRKRENQPHISDINYLKGYREQERFRNKAYLDIIDDNGAGSRKQISNLRLPEEETIEFRSKPPLYPPSQSEREAWPLPSADREHDAEDESSVRSARSRMSDSELSQESIIPRVKAKLGKLQQMYDRVSGLKPSNGSWADSTSSDSESD
jgi:hypothetical protein